MTTISLCFGPTFSHLNHIFTGVYDSFIRAIDLLDDFSILLFHIEIALTFEYGFIFLNYNLSYSVEKYNKTSVKIRSFRMEIFTYIYVLEEALY